MGFGFDTFLSLVPPSNGAPSSVAPGKRTTTTALPSRGATDQVRRDGAGIAMGGEREKDAHNIALTQLAKKAGNLKEKDLSAPEACLEVAALVAAAVAPAEALARIAARGGAPGQTNVQVDDAFFFAQRQEGAEEARKQRDADETPKNDASGLRALDTLAEIAHEYSAAAGSDPRAGVPLVALRALGLVAAPLGWQAATTAREAKAARLQRTPCGPDGHAENPDQCSFSETERESHVSELFRRLDSLFKALAAACTAEAKALTAAIQRDAKMAEAIADLALDMLLAVAPKAVKSTAEVMVAKGVAEVGKEAAKKAKTMKDVLIGLRDDIADTLTKKYTSTLKKKVTDAVAKGDDDPRQNTVTVVEELPTLFQAAVARLDVKALTDDELLALEFSAERSAATVATRVKSLVAAYRKNIEPLGQSRIAPGLPTGTRTTTISARLHPPTGGTPRLAMVKHTSDLDPKARQREAAPIVGLAEIGHGMHLISDETNAEVHERGNDDGERYEFVRWIEAPDATSGIDIAGMADSDAIDLPMTRITGLALGDLAGPTR